MNFFLRANRTGGRSLARRATRNLKFDFRHSGHLDMLPRGPETGLLNFGVLDGAGRGAQWKHSIGGIAIDRGDYNSHVGYR